MIANQQYFSHLLEVKKFLEFLPILGVSPIEWNIESLCLRVSMSGRGSCSLNKVWNVTICTQACWQVFIFRIPGPTLTPRGQSWQHIPHLRQCLLRIHYTFLTTFSNLHSLAYPQSSTSKYCSCERVSKLNLPRLVCKTNYNTNRISCPLESVSG